jgi:ankyrin repeat protein
MFRYLQMMLLLTISILAIGANLPAELASSLGISQLALIVSLAVLIAITLLNRILKLLPTEAETADVSDYYDERQILLAAIAKGDQATLQRLFAMNVNVNFTVDGTTPLHLAAEKGYPEIVRVLISRGADFRKKNAEGRTPLDIALDNTKFVLTTEILVNADKPSGDQVENRRSDSDMWRNQHD